MYDDRNRVIPQYWTLYGTDLARIIHTSIDGLTITVEVQTGMSNKEGFFVIFGESEDTMLHVVIE